MRCEGKWQASNDSERDKSWGRKSLETRNSREIKNEYVTNTYYHFTTLQYSLIFSYSSHEHNQIFSFTYLCRFFYTCLSAVENPKHSDFIKLRTMLISTHMQDLKDVTQDVHYENFRAQCISQISQQAIRERR
jgi:septin family protein